MAKAATDVKVNLNLKTSLVEEVSIELGDIKVIVPRVRLVEVLLSNVLGRNTSSTPAYMPEIGEVWPGQGGVFSGIYRVRGSERNRALITGPRFGEDDDWKAMVAKAEAVEVDGHTDFRLPNRIEQLLQLTNVPELFEKLAYWSGERRADDSSCAWCQSFTYGLQDSYHMDNELRGCAVRTIDI